MTNELIYRDLLDIFSDVFARDDLVLSPGTSARDIVGWDSFRQIEIILAAEQKFGIKLTTREIDGLHNVGDLATLIAGRSMPRKG